jgi:hypothetical protein
MQKYALEVLLITVLRAHFQRMKGTSRKRRATPAVVTSFGSGQEQAGVIDKPLW